jgi:TonB-linked SusC/RagA family outer membrane protein
MSNAWWWRWSLVFLAFFSSSALAQQRRITGQITGTGTAEPLAGASVNVVGTALGTTTGEDGRFSLLVPNESVQLRVRRIGYRQQTVPVAADQAEVNLALERDVLQLTELVITGQATSVARQNVANDIGTVSAEELVRAPSPTVENALAGKVAGASVQQNSGAPGGGLQVQLRGVTTINAPASPLYVVDGVIVSNEAIQSGANAITAAASGGSTVYQDNPVNRIADLNPNDIERMEILKGASASAIYGSKASNGVIIITTKKGESGRPQINLTQRLGTFDLSNKIGSRQWTLEGVYDYFGPETAEDTASRAAQFGDGTTTDYEETLFGENDLSYETSVNVRGGTAATRYFVSGLVKRDAGIMRNTGYDKQSLRANLSQNLGSRLTLDLNTSFVHADTRRGLSNNDNSGTSYYMVLPFTPSYVDLRPSGSEYPANPYQPSNPLQTRDLLNNDEVVYRFTGSVAARYNLLQTEGQSLALNLTGGLDQFSQRNDIYSPNELLFEPQDGLPGTIVQRNTDNVNGNVYLNLVHSFNPASRFFTATTSAGIQRERRELNSTAVTTRGLIPGQSGVNQGSNVTLLPAPDRQLVNDLAFYAQEEFLTLDERLLLTVGARADRSTNNGDVKKFYVFPKASASYRLPGFSIVDELKVRTAFGQSGNPALYGSKFTSLETAVNGGQTGVRVALRAGDPNIKPERQTEVEGGVDLALFGGRSSLTLTGYQKTITDLILLREVATSSGFTQQYFNGAELRNRGLEITAAVTPIQTADATWIARATFARNVSNITELPVSPFETGGFGTSLGAFRIEQGESATQIVGRKPTKTAAGADTTIVTKLGDAAPDFQVGFTNEVNWKGWRLAGLVDWKQGGDIINLTEFLYDAAGNSPDYDIDPNSAGKQRQSRWNQGFTQEYIQDGSYVKVREISLSYMLPANLTGRLSGGFARNVRLELAGRNLFTFSDYRGLDPEVSNFGNQAIARNIDVAPYPPSRSYFFTIDLGF